MPVLKKTTYEKFAQNMAMGMAQYKAAIEAGFSETSASTQAYKLMKNQEVLIRINEIKEEAAQKLILTKHKVLQDLSDIALNEENPLKERISAYKLVGESHGAFIGVREIRVDPVSFEYE